MSSPSPFFPKETLVASNSPSSAMASSSAKRAKIVAALNYSDVDTAQVQMKVHQGAVGSNFWLNIDGEVPRINLTPAGSAKVLYGFDVIGSYDKRSFNSTITTKPPPNESLGIRVQVSGELQFFLKTLDKRCEELYKQLE